MAGRMSKPYAFKPFIFQECSTFGNKEEDANFLKWSWRRKRDPDYKVYLEPETRSGHQIVCDEGNIYSFGGDDMSDTSELLLCYNVGESRWIKLPNLGKVPPNIYNHSAVLHGNSLLVFGGEPSSKTLRMCDLKTLEWTTIETTGQLPRPTFGQAVFLHAVTHSLYVTGGWDFHLRVVPRVSFKDIHKLDLKTFTWERLYVSTRRSEGRREHGVAFLGDLIYILGGDSESVYYHCRLDEIPAFNVKSRTWTTLQAVVEGDEREPTPRMALTCNQVGEDVFISGGKADRYTVLEDFWKLNLPTLTWTKFTCKMPLPLWSHSSCVTKSGCMFIFGGSTYGPMDEYDDTPDIHELSNRIFKVWLKVPTLKEMCWEAVLHYNKNIGLISRSDLRKIGIPKEFSDRVHPSPPCGPDSKSINEHWINNSLA